MSSSPASLQQKYFVKAILNSRITLSFLLGYSFGIETTNTLIHNRISLVNLTRFQTRGQNLFPFSDQNSAKTQKPYPLGQHSRVCVYNTTI